MTTYTPSFPALKVEIGFTGTDPASYVFTDVSSDVRSISTSRGRQRQIEAFAAGTCSFVLDNNTGNYDPDNPNSIYVSASQPPVTNMRPMRPVRVTATWNSISYPIWFGYIDGVTPDYAPGKYSDAWVTVTATDGMKVLNNDVASGARPIELTGARIAAILASIGWYVSYETLATGDVYLQATTLAATAGQEIQNAVDSELGRWYIGANGYVIFENRSSRSINQAPVATWSDTNTSGLLYSSLTRAIDDDLLRNFVTVTNQGGTPQSVTDVTSVSQYGPRSYSQSSTLLTADSEAYELATVLLYQGANLKGCRFEAVNFDPVTSIPAAAAGDLWPEMLGREISDRIAVVVTPPYVTPMTIPCYVEGVSHTVTTNPRNWQTSFHVSRGDFTNFLLLDDPTYGHLDTNTVGF